MKVGAALPSGGSRFQEYKSATAGGIEKLSGTLFGFRSASSAAVASVPLRPIVSTTDEGTMTMDPRSLIAS